jgi:hypothetical protein
MPICAGIIMGHPERSEGSAVFFSSDVVEGTRESRSFASLRMTLKVWVSHQCSVVKAIFSHLLESRAT